MESASLPKGQQIYSPYVERTARDKNFAEGLFWGDTHLHTSYSTDAGMIGSTLPPEQAFRASPGRGGHHQHGSASALDSAAGLPGGLGSRRARVLEIPTPTWQAYDANFYGVTMPPQVPLSHQERAYTSPIWYTP
jgi:hypothetical protein